MDELLPAGGAVQGADLVEVPGDVLQSGHVDHQLIADGGPEQQQDDGDLAQGRSASHLGPSVTPKIFMITELMIPSLRNMS